MVGTYDENCFDPSAWESRVAPLEPGPTGLLSTHEIIGPRYACWVLKMRELVRPYVDFGPSSPIDLFLFSIGDAPQRACTKIGGLPFWPRGREWPKASGEHPPDFIRYPTWPPSIIPTAAGEPLPFLAQFCFRDSHDIIGGTPEDLLLLFGDKDFPWTIVAKWQSSRDENTIVDRNDLPVTSPFPCYSGCRWRTESFGNADIDDDSIQLPDGRRVYDLWFVCELPGMQIGPRPFFPRWGGTPTADDRTICTLCSLFPSDGVPWPFLNRSEPLSEDESRLLAFDLTSIKDLDGFAAICVVVGESGEPVVLYQEM